MCFTPEWHFVLKVFLRHFKEFVLVTLRGEQIYSRCLFPNAIHLGVFFFRSLSLCCEWLTCSADVLEMYFSTTSVQNAPQVFKSLSPINAHAHI